MQANPSPWLRRFTGLAICVFLLLPLGSCAGITGLLTGGPTGFIDLPATLLASATRTSRAARTISCRFAVLSLLSSGSFRFQFRSGITFRASAPFDPANPIRFPPSKVTDGTTQEVQRNEGYWLLPGAKPGWIEIDLSDVPPEE